MCPPTGMALCKAVMAGVAVTITSDYFIVLLFLPSVIVALNSKILFARFAGENALLLDQNRMDEGNGPQSIKAKSLPKFWETIFYHLAPKRTLNILQWDQTQPGHPWHLGNSDFPTVSGAGFGCETKAGQSIKELLLIFASLKLLSAFTMGRCPGYPDIQHGIFRQSKVMCINLSHHWNSLCRSRRDTFSCSTNS